MKTDRKVYIPEDPERKVLISRLTKIYPYPEEWFHTRTTAQLNAMYKLPRKDRPKRNAAKLIYNEPKEADYRRFNEELGIYEIKTDGHGWEPEIK